MVAANTNKRTLIERFDAGHLPHGRGGDGMSRDAPVGGTTVRSNRYLFLLHDVILAPITPPDLAT